MQESNLDESEVKAGTAIVIPATVPNAKRDQKINFISRYLLKLNDKIAAMQARFIF